MPKDLTSSIPLHIVKAQFLADAEKLWDKHAEEISKVLSESETSKMNVTFRAALDFSESPKLETLISFQQVVKDSSKFTFPEPEAVDPNQQSLFAPGSAAEELAQSQSETPAEA